MYTGDALLLTLSLRPEHPICKSVITFAVVVATCGLLRAENTATDAPALFAQYCYDCHGRGEKSGQIALDQMLNADPAQTNRTEWKKAWKIVRQEFMPPFDAERPSDAQRKIITQWIEQK